MIESIIKHDGKEIKIATLYKTDILYNRCFKNGIFYEQNLLNKVKSFNKEGIYVDLGANVGNHSLFFGLFCPSTKIISIEAEPEIAKVLEHNLSRNIPEKYEIINKAVSDFNGFVEMDGLVQRNVGGTSINSKGVGNVECVTLDDILGNLTNVAVLKMDIEGEEHNAIRKSEKFFSNNSPVVIAELKDRNQFNEFKSLIGKYGYTTDGINYAVSATYVWVKK
jgi:FkbM family methyltransferase